MHKPLAQPSSKKPTKKSVPRWVLLLVALAVVAYVGVTAKNTRVTAEDMAALEQEQEMRGECTSGGLNVKGEAKVNTALHAWKSGMSSASLWKNGIERKSLYAVREYESLEHGDVLDKKTGKVRDASWYKMRVSSSTRGGLPITKDWTFWVEKDGSECRIYDITED